MSNLILKARADSDVEIKLELIDKKIKKLGKTTRGFGDVLKGVLAAKAISQGFILIQRGFQAMGREALKYEDTLKNIEGITQSSAKSIKILHTALISSTNGMAIVTSKAAETALAINKMGFNAEETSRALSISLNLATASIVDSTEAATVAVQTMRSFGLELKDLEHVANVIQTTVSKTSINFMEYAEAMKFVAPIADRVNVSLEEMSASIGFLGNIGLKGSIGGTALKNMLLNLLKPGESVKNMLMRMNDEGAGLIDILMQMKSEDMGIGDFLGSFNKRALAASLNLSETGEGVKALMILLEEERVKIKEVAGVMNQSFSKQLIILKNNLFNVSNEFIVTAATGGTFVDAFAGVNEVLQDAQKWIKENDAIVKEFATNIVDLTANMLTLVGSGFKALIEHGDILAGIFGVLTTMKFASLIAGTNGFGTAIAIAGKKIAIAHPWLLALEVAVIAVDLAMAGYIDHVDDMVDRTRTLDQTKAVNLKKQSAALGEYYTSLFNYEKKLASIKLAENILYKGKTHQGMRDRASMELEKSGNKIEDKFGLPSNFLDTILNKESANSQIASLVNKYNELLPAEIDALDKNTEAQKKADTLLSELKKALEEAERKKTPKKAAELSAKLEKKLPNEVQLIWSRDLLTDLEDSISKTFTSSRGDALLNPIVGAESSLSNDIFAAGIKDLIASFSEESDEIGRLVNKLGSMQTPKSLVSDFGSTGFDSPLTQLDSDEGTKNPNLVGGQASIGLIILPRIEKIINDMTDKLASEKFRINLEIAELNISQTEAYINAFENINLEIEQDIKAIAKLKSDIKGLEQETQDHLNNVADGFAQYGGIVLNVFDLIAQVQDAQFEKEQRNLDKRLVNVKRERVLSIAAHKDVRSAKYLIDKDYDKKEQEILKQKEANEDEYRRKQKAAAVVTALINTALAVTAAIATAKTNPERIAMGIIVGALGLSQVGIIASQNYREGGSINGIGTLMSGVGGGASDSIPVLASDNEYMIKSRTVAALGGAGGVEDMIESRLDSESGSGRSLNVYVENLYDDVEHTRNTMESVLDQTERMVY